MGSPPTCVSLSGTDASDGAAAGLRDLPPRVRGADSLLRIGSAERIRRIKKLQGKGLTLAAVEQVLRRSTPAAFVRSGTSGLTVDAASERSAREMRNAEQR